MAIISLNFQKLDNIKQSEKNMHILSFESSCDETACAVLEMSEQNRILKSNIIASQVDIHALYGGVVPEIASRAHIEAISKIT